jgi:hypothetical protein
MGGFSKYGAQEVNETVSINVKRRFMEVIFGGFSS